MLIKNITKEREFGERMLFMHSNRCLPETFCLVTYDTLIIVNYFMK